MLHFLSTTIFQLKIQTAAVEMSLLPKVKALSIEEFEKFKWLLQFTYFKKSLPNISWSTLEWAETAYQLVVLMEHKPQSLEVTEEVLMDMRIVPEETLPETSWGLKGQRQETETDSLHHHLFLMTLIHRL